jgi:hypothetical protein
MGIRAFVLAWLLLAPGTTASMAAVRISDDPGGRIGTYMRTYAILRNSGETVIIDGPCLSACTLILGFIPYDRVCVTRRARLGFHAAWLPDDDGRPVRNDAGTQVLMDLYPAKVRRWIRRKGGLSHRMIYLRGRELTALYRRCP